MKPRPLVKAGEFEAGYLVVPHTPYTCTECGAWDPDLGGAAPPLLGVWFCRDHLAAALKRGGRRRSP